MWQMPCITASDFRGAEATPGRSRQPVQNEDAGTEGADFYYAH
jgi:hypothetical protein